MAAVSSTSPSSPQVGNNISVMSTAEPAPLSTQPQRSKQRGEGKSRIPVVGILASDLNLRGLIYVQNKFSDLIRLCLLSKKGRAPVLKGGGGTMSIDRTRLQFLYNQIVHQDRVISRVRTTIARRQARHQLIRANQEQEPK